jgi:hypothetical protein
MQRVNSKSVAIALHYIFFTATVFSSMAEGD